MSNTKKKDKATVNATTQKKPSWNMSEPVSINDPYASNRTSLTPKNFERLILQHGIRVKIYRTFFCPNVKDVDSGQHEIDCQVPGCSRGYIDVDPIDTMCLIQRQELIKRQSAEGFVDDQSCHGTFLLGINLQYMTLVELQDYFQIYYELIKRSTGDSDTTKFSAKRVNIIMDKKGIRYYQTIDFHVSPTGTIQWIANRGPEAGEIYSIHYESNVRYRCTKAVQVSRFTQIKNSDGTVAFQKMPELWTLNREFMPKNLDFNGNEILPNKIVDDDDSTEE